MLTETFHQDRRDEERFAMSGRLIWRNHDQDTAKIGRLLDYSTCGLSFVTRTDDAMTKDEPILISTVHDVGVPYRICHCDELGDGAWLLGCESMSSSARMARSARIDGYDRIVGRDEAEPLH